MSKRSGDSGAAERAHVLVLSPEAPFPAVGGGALRTASLVHYFARRGPVDLILFRQPGEADPAAAIPDSVGGERFVMNLSFHARHGAARLWRNAARAVRGVPPLVDRFRGFDGEIAGALAGRRYRLGVIEHFWCAPYLRLLEAYCEEVWVDLHNVESVLQGREAEVAVGPARLGFRRFARAYAALEGELLPRFDRVLVASPEDAEAVKKLAPGTKTTIFPNTIPLHPRPVRVPDHCIAFSGNLAYQPNIEAVRYFAREVWPLLRAKWPGLVWRIIGKNPAAIARFVSGADYIQVVGPVEDAIGELARARVAVVPVLAGSGTRVKILEAWAAGTPVVSTGVGAEGLGARDGEHLLVAGSPLQFSETVSVLLTSQGLRQQIGAGGRKLYEERFSWEAGWRVLDETVCVS
jgi:glycosyltransferase involved in cell wall biosynthesis